MRAITWVSAFEQDVAAMNNLLVRIRYDEGLSNVAAGLEALLFFRLRREWTERNRYSSLVEQLQLAAALGESIEADICLHVIAFRLRCRPSSHTYTLHA